MKIVVSRNELQAVSLFASTDNSRYILNGVNIEVKPEKPPLLVATDGRRLAAIESVAEQQEEITEPHSFVISSEFIALIVRVSKSCGGKVLKWLTLETKPGSTRLVASVFGGHVSLDAEKNALIEGNYPTWRKTIPDASLPRQALTEVGFNAEYIGDFAKVAKLLESDTSAIAMNLINKEAPMEVTINGRPTFYGLIMPCKLDESVRYQPDFIAAAVAEEVKAAA